MEKTIKKGDIISASLEAATKGKLGELFEKTPLLMLFVPVIADEIEGVIFKEEKEEE